MAERPTLRLLIAIRRRVIPITLSMIAITVKRKSATDTLLGFRMG
ncbi:hypothetical protein [Azospirillum argentinense]